jgi:hypothetical protein
LATKIGSALQELSGRGQSRVSRAYDNNSGRLCPFPNIAQLNKPRTVTKFG